MDKFSLYKIYLTELNKLNVFQFKKIINALSKYADNKTIPNNLSRKSLDIFSEIIRIIDVEIETQDLSEKRSKSGKKGAKKRWN